VFAARRAASIANCLAAAVRWVWSFATGTDSVVLSMTFSSIWKTLRRRVYAPRPAFVSAQKEPTDGYPWALSIHPGKA
jgi:hypothetical protein